MKEQQRSTAPFLGRLIPHTQRLQKTALHFPVVQIKFRAPPVNVLIPTQEPCFSELLPSPILEIQVFLHL